MTVQHEDDALAVSASTERRMASRRHGLGRRGADMGSNDDLLRALIEAERDARRADQEHNERRLSQLESRLDRLIGRVLVASGIFVAVVFLANWIGPTVFRRAIDALFGTGP